MLRALQSATKIARTTNRRTTMRFITLVVATLLAAVASTPGRAGNENPVVSIEIIGRSNFHVGLAETLTDRFTVRVTHASGAPRPGVSVDFFVNVQLEFPEPPPGSVPLPPSETYGHFDTTMPYRVTTDANGIAVAPAFTSGTLAGEYDVVAYVSPNAPGNSDIGFPVPIAYFHIRQLGGQGAITEMPTASPLTLAVLALMLAGVALVATRRRSAPRR
jgi:hypothetical protein